MINNLCMAVENGPYFALYGRNNVKWLVLKKLKPRRIYPIKLLTSFSFILFLYIFLLDPVSHRAITRANNLTGSVCIS